MQDGTEVPSGWSPTNAFKASLPVPTIETKTHVNEGSVDLTRKTARPPSAHGGTATRPVSEATDVIDLTTIRKVTKDIRG